MNGAEGVDYIMLTVFYFCWTSAGKSLLLFVLLNDAWSQ